jgi:hypothetical protein
MIGDFILMVAFGVAAGALVLGGPALAIYLARASFRGPAHAPGVAPPSGKWVEQ